MKNPSNTITQAFAVGGIVLVLALLNSWINPTAVDLGRNYFAKVHDFQTIEAADILEFLPDLLESDFAVLIDARDADHYAAGHIPGAYLLDNYNLEDTLHLALPAMQAAGFVIVYCKGGDCEDSIFLATDLVYRHGIEKEVVYIYEGGTEHWEALGHPLKEGMDR
ncbi:MAG: rhodanese-like domain-containing protein [Planctomycetota bacterium]|jgi:rhodanese-related sulfurtransferase